MPTHTVIPSTNLIKQNYNHQKHWLECGFLFSKMDIQVAAGVRHHYKCILHLHHHTKQSIEGPGVAFQISLFFLTPMDLVIQTLKHKITFFFRKTVIIIHLRTHIRWFAPSFNVSIITQPSFKCTSV